jgi:16S rRNA (cytosine1402-N4)-methyltransferase
MDIDNNDYTHVHVPVMVEEVVRYLMPEYGKIYIDATIGAGGHAKALLNAGAKVIGIDQDEEILEIAKKRLIRFGDRIVLVNDNFENLYKIVKQYNIPPVDGILYDLGLSMFQINSPNRGFSFQIDAPLDMRMSLSSGELTAKIIVNEYSEREIFRIIKEYGEERWARGIAKAIVRNRPINTTWELVDAVRQGLPKRARYPKHIHYATRTFQAIRIAVNNELKVLDTSLKAATSILKRGGRIVVISFHSLEDRIVKWCFLQQAKEERLRIITKKPVLPKEIEKQQNPGARSAKLRVAEKNKKVYKEVPAPQTLTE